MEFFWPLWMSGKKFIPNKTTTKDWFLRNCIWNIFITFSNNGPILWASSITNQGLPAIQLRPQILSCDVTRRSNNVPTSWSLIDHFPLASCMSGFVPSLTAVTRLPSTLPQAPPPPCESPSHSPLFGFWAFVASAFPLCSPQETTASVSLPTETWRLFLAHESI